MNIWVLVQYHDEIKDEQDTKTIHHTDSTPPDGRSEYKPITHITIHKELKWYVCPLDGKK